MKARLTYGPFTCDLVIHDAPYILSVPKPMALPTMQDSFIDVTQIATHRLNFRLMKPPRPGELVEYKFEGES